MSTDTPAPVQRSHVLTKDTAAFERGLLSEIGTSFAPVDYYHPDTNTFGKASTTSNEWPRIPLATPVESWSSPRATRDAQDRPFGRDPLQLKRRRYDCGRFIFDVFTPPLQGLVVVTDQEADNPFVPDWVSRRLSLHEAAPLHPIMTPRFLYHLASHDCFRQVSSARETSTAPAVLRDRLGEKLVPLIALYGMPESGIHRTLEALELDRSITLLPRRLYTGLLGACAKPDDTGSGGQRALSATWRTLELIQLIAAHEAHQQKKQCVVIEGGGPELVALLRVLLRNQRLDRALNDLCPRVFGATVQDIFRLYQGGIHLLAPRDPTRRQSGTVANASGYGDSMSADAAREADAAITTLWLSYSGQDRYKSLSLDVSATGNTVREHISAILALPPQNA